MFVQLHGHSHYSLLEAIGKPKDLIAQAKKLGMSALGLTDYNGMYGAIDFYKTCLKEEIKPLLGVELVLVQDRTNKETKENPGTICLLAKNHQGYLDLLEIVSHANLE
jgi:DNA polymerase-3 subunit alpha